MVHHALHDMFFADLAIEGLTEQYGIFVFGGDIFDGANGRGEIELAQIGQEHANGKRPSLLKKNGLLILEYR